ncbi:MAG: glycerophosphodiester phosphodiesterase [Actinomycetota bacterium]|nr:glycerophosphodiester phosphodiesterase [Actinomycetota bacterium]
MPSRWSFLDWPTPIALAHRGGSAEAPENTMVAFEAAMKLGYTYLETDVHTTADGVLVAFHDHDLDRVSDRRGRISELPYVQVRQARVQGEPIPLLEDILGAWPEARVNIDAKHDACVPALVETIERTGAHSRVCIGAFSTRRAKRLRLMTGGRVCSWMGRTELFRLRLHSLGLPRRAHVPQTSCAEAPIRQGSLRMVDRSFVDVAHGGGVVVLVWTVNDRQDMEDMLDLGVDGIFSDRPTMLKQVLEQRGLWT